MEHHINLPSEEAPDEARLEVGILDVLDVVCARGFVRAATRLCLTSKTVAAAAPMGTGRQVYDAAKSGNAEQLTTYLAYWRGNRDSPEVVNWAPAPLGIAVKVKKGQLIHAQFEDSPLRAAVVNDRLACVELLVSCAPGVDVNKGSQATSLHFACRRGSMPIIRALLSSPAIDVNLIDTTLCSPLHLAVLSGNTEVVRLLVSVKGIKIDAAYRGQKTAMGLATALQFGDMVAILAEAVEKKRAIDAVRKQVYEAARNGDMDKLRPLVKQWSGNLEMLNYRDKDAPPARWGNSSAATPIVAAAANGRVNVIRLLLSSAPIDPNEIDEEGRSVLTEAAFRGQVDVVRFLLTVEGIDINVGAPHGTPLQLTDCWGSKMGEDTWERKLKCAAILRAAGAHDPPYKPA